MQARTQAEAVCTVRAIDEVRVYAPTREHADAFIDDMAGFGLVPDDIVAAERPANAVRGADIVCTVTISMTPVFSDRDIAPGVHINGIGSYMPNMQEIPQETVLRATVVVDDRAAALAEAGDLIVPVRNGLMTAEKIHADLGEVVLGRKPGRTRPDEITLFKSVGIAVLQDAAAAHRAVRCARERGLGQHVSW